MNLRSLFGPSLLIGGALCANNITVSNVTLSGQNTVVDTWQVNFDLGWENSWRTSTAEANYDAAWVFIKYRFGPNADWRHALITSAGSGGPVGCSVGVPSDARGAFVFRTNNGIGNVSYPGITLTWNYAATGVQDTDPIEIRVVAIEMVFSAFGSMALGDGATTNVNGQYELAQSGAPFVVNSEAQITLGGSGATNLNARNNGTGFDDYGYSTTQTLPAAYPKGVNAFYAMKYEVSEGQYVDFLNTLTPAQAAARFPNQTGNQGHTIDDNGAAPDIYTTTAPERACGYLSFNAQMAYADWAALRPLTEFEYEKLCRGNRPAVAGEYAWGNTFLYTITATLGNVGTATELVTNPAVGGIANHAGINAGNVRPWRVAGIAASFTTPTRQEASAGYYGAMELSGNLVESCVSTAGPDARGFTAANGDGALTAVGAANVATWPTVGASVQRRGGGYSDPATRLRVSDRSGANLAFTNAGSDNGGRFGRLP